MVFALVLLTILVFISVSLLLKKEDRMMKETEKSKKSPIFLSPEKSLLPLGIDDSKLFHLSHSWVAPAQDGNVYVGYDNFISSIFSSDVKIMDLPLVGVHLSQGTKIWDIKQKKHEIKQLSPISGEVIALNPACFADISLASDQLGKSWILKMKPDRLNFESNNLMKYNQAIVHNYALKDELIQMVQDEKYMNDGGQIDSEFINNLSDKEWENIVEKFFPYQNSNVEV
jgi:glycine cleavage system H lipoate-binding protein